MGTTAHELHGRDKHDSKSHGGGNIRSLDRGSPVSLPNYPERMESVSMNTLLPWTDVDRMSLCRPPAAEDYRGPHLPTCRRQETHYWRLTSHEPSATLSFIMLLSRVIIKILPVHLTWWPRIYKYTYSPWRCEHVYKPVSTDQPCVCAFSRSGRPSSGLGVTVNTQTKTSTWLLD